MAVSSLRLPGNPWAANTMGRVPVVGMRKRKGCPGRQPCTLGPLIRGAGPGGGVSATAGSRISGRSMALGLAPLATSLASAQSAWSKLIPSPASPTSRRSVLTPLTSRSTSFAVWPGFITPDSQSFRPSPTILKVMEAGPPAASSTPTKARNRSEPPARLIQNELLACVPTPCANVRPPMASGFSRMDRSVCGWPQPCFILDKSRAVRGMVSAAAVVRAAPTTSTDNKAFMTTGLDTKRLEERKSFVGRDPELGPALPDGLPLPGTMQLGRGAPAAGRLCPAARRAPPARLSLRAVR